MGDFSYLYDDLAEVTGDKSYLKQKPKVQDDITPLLERMRGSIGEQESGNNYQVTPNARTSATGKFQVIPENIPSWTRKYFGKSLTPQEFQNNPQAQDAVFAGEMGNYLRKAKAKGVDDDTAIRMGAAAWYGGEGNMMNYDAPWGGKGNEPSFRTYTNSVLNRTKKSEPKAPDYSFVQQDLDEILGASQTPQNDYSFVSQDLADLGLNAPVKEPNSTIQGQIASANDPNVKTRFGVLSTDDTQATLFANEPNFKPFPTENGTLWLNTSKIYADKKLKLKNEKDLAQYVAKNPKALTTLIGITSDVGTNTSNGTALTVTDPVTNTELASAVVPNEEAIDLQAEAYADQFPHGTQSLTTTDEIAAKRDVDRLAEGDGQAEVKALFDQYLKDTQQTDSNESRKAFNDEQGMHYAMAKKGIDQYNATQKGQAVKKQKVTRATSPQTAKDEPFDEAQFNLANEDLASRGEQPLTKEQYQSAVKSFKGSTSVSLPTSGEVDGEKVVGSNYREPVEVQEIEAKNAGKAYADIIDIPDTVKTPEQASEYAIKQLQAKYPDGKFSGANFPKGWEVGDKQIGITYDTLKGAGVDTEPLINEKVIENRVNGEAPVAKSLPKKPASEELVADAKLRKDAQNAVTDAFSLFDIDDLERGAKALWNDPSSLWTGKTPEITLTNEEQVARMDARRKAADEGITELIRNAGSASKMIELQKEYEALGNFEKGVRHVGDLSTAVLRSPAMFAKTAAWLEDTIGYLHEKGIPLPTLTPTEILNAIQWTHTKMSGNPNTPIKAGALPNLYAKIIEKAYPDDPMTRNTFAGKMSRAVGSAVPFLLGAALSGGSTSVVAMLGMGMSVGDMYGQAQDAGLSREKQILSGFTGIPLGLSELLGLKFAKLGELIESRSKGAFSKGLMSWLKETGKEATEETLQEYFQSASGKLVIQGLKNDGLTKKDVLKALGDSVDDAMTGGIVGALLGGGVPIAAKVANAVESPLTKGDSDALLKAEPVKVTATPTSTTETVEEPTKPVAPKKSETEDVDTLRKAYDADPLTGLKREAINTKTFEEFERGFTQDIKHGVYYHFTADPNFSPKDDIGSRDMSSMGDGNVEKGSYMVTSHPELWDEHYNTDPDTDEPYETPKRGYVAVIDLADVPKVKQVNRGFGNEIYLDAQQAKRSKVIKVLPVAEARKFAKEYFAQIPQSKEELKALWDGAHNISPKTDSLGDDAQKAADAENARIAQGQLDKLKADKAAKVAKTESVTHWTNSDGLQGILDSGSIQEGSHFTKSLDVPFDVDNDMSFGVVMNRDAVDKAGYKSLPKDAKGVTALEIEHELLGGKDIDTTNIEKFVVRSEKAKTELQAILDANDIGQTPIEVVGKPRYKTFDKPESIPTPKQEDVVIPSAQTKATPVEDAKGGFVFVEPKVTATETTTDSDTGIRDLSDGEKQQYVDNLPITKKGDKFVVKDLWVGKTFDSKADAQKALDEYVSARSRVTDWRKAADSTDDIMKSSSILRTVARKTADDSEASDILDRLPDGYGNRSNVAWEIVTNPRLGEDVRRRAADLYETFKLGGDGHAVIDKSLASKTTPTTDLEEHRLEMAEKEAEVERLIASGKVADANKLRTQIGADRIAFKKAQKQLPINNDLPNGTKLVRKIDGKQGVVFTDPKLGKRLKTGENSSTRITETQWQHPDNRPLEMAVDKQAEEYPLATNTVDGRTVRDNVDNQSSIGASLDNYEILRGIREVPMSDFVATGTHYSLQGTNRIKELASQIDGSGEISPLIVVVGEPEGPYILEGGTRLEALHRLGAKSFPAMVVVDTDSTLNKLPEKVTPEMESIKRVPTQNLAQNIKVTRDGSLITLDNLDTYGLVMQAMEHTFGGDYNSFGITLDPAQVKKVRATLQQLAPQLKGKARANATKLLTTFNQAASDLSSGERETVKFALIPDAIGEENVHERRIQTMLDDDVKKSQSKDWIDNTTNSDLFKKSSVGRKYKGKPKAIQAIEFIDKIAAGQFEDLEIDPVADREAIISAVQDWAKDYETVNGNQSWKDFAKLNETAAYFAQKISETSSESEAESATDTVEQTEQRQEARDDSSDVGAVEFEPSGKTKQSKTPKTLRGNLDLPVKDVDYTSTSNPERKEFADKQLAKGMDSAEAWVQSQIEDDNSNHGATATVGIGVINALGADGQIDRMNDLTKKLLPTITDAAQTVQAVSTASMWNPESARAYAALAKQKHQKKGMTQAESDEAYSIAKQMHNSVVEGGVNVARLQELETRLAELISENVEMSEALDTANSQVKQLQLDLDKAVEASGKKPRVKKAVKDIKPRLAEINKRLEARYGVSDSPLQMAVGREIDQDLIDWTIATLDENLSKLNAEQMKTLIHQKTNGMLTDAEIDEIHAIASESLTTKHEPKTDAQKAESRNRLSHFASMRKFNIGELNLDPDALMKDGSKRSKFIDYIIETGKGYSPEAVYTALLRQSVKSENDVIKKLRERYGVDKTDKKGNVTRELDNEFGILRDGENLLKEAKKNLRDDNLLRELNTKLTSDEIDVVRAMQADVMNERRVISRQAKNFYDGLLKSKKQIKVETLVNFRRANLLTGVKTHTQNIIGNVAFAAAEELSRPLASLADFATSFVTGQRTIQGISPKALTASFKGIFTDKGMLKNAERKSGIEAVKDIWKYGGSREDMERLQHGESILERGVKEGDDKSPRVWRKQVARVVDSYINHVYRTLGAEDALFKVYAFTRAIREASYRISITEQAERNESDDWQKEREKQLNLNPTKVMIENADDFAQFMTFQNDNALSTAIQAFKGNHYSVKAAVETLMPYDRTPTNLVARALEYAPGTGLIATVYKGARIKYKPTQKFTHRGWKTDVDWRARYSSAVRQDYVHELNKMSKVEQAQFIEDILNKEWTRKQQQDFARTFGRMAPGNLLFLTGAFLAASGLLTGAMSPDDDDKKETKEFFERQANGIENRSLYIPRVGRFTLPKSPPMDIIVAGATFYEQMQMSKGDPIMGMMNAGQETLGDLIYEQPLFRSTGDLMKTVHKGKWGEFTGNIVSGYVPFSGLMREVGEITDDKPRAQSGYDPSDNEKTGGAKARQMLRGFRNASLRGIPLVRNYAVPESTASIPQPERGSWQWRVFRAIPPVNIFSPRSPRPYDKWSKDNLKNIRQNILPDTMQSQANGSVLKSQVKKKAKK